MYIKGWKCFNADMSCKAYQVIGWYKSLPEEAIGKSTTISDGAFFSTEEKAVKWANENKVQWSIREREVSGKQADWVDMFIDEEIEKIFWEKHL